jgi:hypothetical protein
MIGTTVTFTVGWILSAIFGESQGKSSPNNKGHFPTDRAVGTSK